MIKIKRLIKFVAKKTLELEKKIPKIYSGFLQAQHDEKSHVGVVGVGAIDEKNYYLTGDIPAAKVFKGEDAGAMARHIAKTALLTQWGPMPPDKGVPHKLILIPLPTFFWETTPDEQYAFLESWKALIESYEGLPYCEFTTWR